MNSEYIFNETAVNLLNKYKRLHLTYTLRSSYIDVYANHISGFWVFCCSANSEQLRKQFLQYL